MFAGHLWSHMFHNDQWPADSSTITCDIDRFVVVIYINTDKLVDLASTPQLAELSYESGREPSNTDDETVDVYHEGGRSVDFCACRHHNVWKNRLLQTNKPTERRSHLPHPIE